MFGVLCQMLCIGIVGWFISEGFPWWADFVLVMAFFSVAIFFMLRMDRVIVAQPPGAPSDVADNFKLAKVVIAVLVIGLFALLGILAYTLWQRFLWKQQVYALAAYEGGERATHDYQAGKLRLFVIAGERSDNKYSGTNDGPFEIWYPQYFPDSYPLRYETEVMVSYYNHDMQFSYAHPKESIAATNNVKQTRTIGK